jgi:xanthine dehydrogenase accessory factor
MGSRRRTSGASCGCERVLAPIGLDIGARTPEETAISIVSEIIALRAQRRAPSPREGSGLIHG